MLLKMCRNTAAGPKFSRKFRAKDNLCEGITCSALSMRERCEPCFLEQCVLAGRRRLGQASVYTCWLSTSQDGLKWDFMEGDVVGSSRKQPVRPTTSIITTTTTKPPGQSTHTTEAHDHDEGAADDDDEESNGR